MSLNACPSDCADCAFNTHEDAGWEFVQPQNARSFFTRRWSRINRRRATPFLNDIYTRGIFETVKTGEQL